MGRKKKIQEEEQIIAKPTEQTKSAETSIGYAGSVTVKIANNKKVLSSKVYHNAGTDELFKFFAKCITEDFTGLTNLVPKMVEVGRADPQSIYTACSIRVIKSAATYSAEDTSTTIHFRIPSHLIFNRKEINAIKLFNTNGKECANILLDQAIAEIPENFNLVIEWTMSFYNKTTEA